MMRPGWRRIAVVRSGPAFGALSRSRAGALLLLACLVGCGQCGGCNQTPPLAVLQAMSPDGVLRDFGAAPAVWSSADLGAEFRVGDGVKTAPGAEAQLVLADGNLLDLPEKTLLRFLVEGTGEQEAPRYEVEAGAAVFSAREAQLRLLTHFGMAVLQPGARVRIERGQARLQIAVEVGSARFNTAEGAVDAAAGESFEVGIGEAVLRRVGGMDAAQDEAEPVDGASLSDEEDGADPQADDDDEDETSGRFEPGLAYANLGLGIGNSATVHAPEVPIAVGFHVGGKCDGEAAVRLGSGRPWYRGTGMVSVNADLGVHRYQVRCLRGNTLQKGAVARGRLHVLRDAGTRRLPRKPPTSFVDTDGRTYQVHYQNQRPMIVVRWPRAPEAQRYTLHVDNSTRSVASPEYTFPSGALSDGTHQIAFEAAGRRSRTTTLGVRFDNTASTASLSAPADRGFAAGELVSVAGVALPGWKVSAEGGTIETEQGNRFHGEIRTSAATPDVVLKLSHPRLGTHYYLRRASRSP